MKVIDKRENPAVSCIYLGTLENGKLVEFADSIQPPLSIDEKWVLIVSTLYGCPVKCKMCDAGSSMDYTGSISEESIFDQIDYMVKRRFPNGLPQIKKFKIQLARMGEPSFNTDVLEVLNKLPAKYPIPGLIPSVSSVAPAGKENFFDELISIKDTYYPNGKFQLQFSIHTTDEAKRDWLIPIKKWSFREIAEYGEKFFKRGDRKITLNFALGEDMPLSPDVLVKFFDPNKFLVKITPLNPTLQSVKNKLTSKINKEEKEVESLVGALKRSGYEVIVSIGALEENEIGSNCGQFVTKYLNEKNNQIKNGYKYWESK